MTRSPRPPLLLALAGAVLLACTGVLAYLVPIAHEQDSTTLRGFEALDQPRLNPLLSHLAHLCDPVSYGALGLGLIAMALWRRRPRTAAAVFVLLVATGVITHELKYTLASPREDDWLGAGQIAAASWPSGHATAAMTLALCAVLASPARLRPTVAGLGALFALAVSYSVLALGWHFPSDVVGGFLVAGTCTALAVAALLWAERLRPSGARAEAPPRAHDALGPLVLGVGAAAAVALVGLARPAAVVRFATDHTTMLLFAMALAALATLIAEGMARVSPLGR